MRSNKRPLALCNKNLPEQSDRPNKVAKLNDTNIANKYNATIDLFCNPNFSDLFLFNIVKHIVDATDDDLIISRLLIDLSVKIEDDYVMPQRQQNQNICLLLNYGATPYVFLHLTECLTALENVGALCKKTYNSYWYDNYKNLTGISMQTHNNLISCCDRFHNNPMFLEYLLIQYHDTSVEYITTSEQLPKTSLFVERVADSDTGVNITIDMTYKYKCRRYLRFDNLKKFNRYISDVNAILLKTTSSHIFYHFKQVITHVICERAYDVSRESSNFANCEILSYSPNNIINASFPETFGISDHLNANNFKARDVLIDDGRFICSIEYIRNFERNIKQRTEHVVLDMRDTEKNKDHIRCHRFYIHKQTTIRDANLIKSPVIVECANSTEFDKQPSCDDASSRTKQIKRDESLHFPNTDPTYVRDLKKLEMLDYVSNCTNFKITYDTYLYRVKNISINIPKHLAMYKIMCNKRNKFKTHVKSTCFVTNNDTNVITFVPDALGQRADTFADLDQNARYFCHAVKNLSWNTVHDVIF
jgi:hypothetical protein